MLKDDYVTGDILSPNDVNDANKLTNALTNPARWFGEALSAINVTIPSAGTRVSPSAVTPKGGIYQKDFDYTTNPGKITYIGDLPLLVKASGSISLSSNTNNVISKFQWAVNDNTADGTPRKISTAGDVGNISAPDYIYITNGQYLDFFLTADSSCVLTIQPVSKFIIESAVINPE